MEELLWEDLGHNPSLEDQRIDGDAREDAWVEELYQVLPSGEVGDDQQTSRIDPIGLEKVDGKYAALLKFLARQIQSNPGEKFVVFAFFRGTLRYLERRLNEDGIPAVVIMGGMGDTKDVVLRTFRDPTGPAVLLSSEVGSEGIDLEHCRFMVNYDLPWNPMKVEQRIGRLDRLGQQAERISIVNISVTDTIEDRIFAGDSMSESIFLKKALVIWRVFLAMRLSA